VPACFPRPRGVGPVLVSSLSDAYLMPTSIPKSSLRHAYVTGIAPLFLKGGKRGQPEGQREHKRKNAKNEPIYVHLLTIQQVTNMMNTGVHNPTSY